jgi:hypothetical protein
MHRKILGWGTAYENLRLKWRWCFRLRLFGCSQILKSRWIKKLGVVKFYGFGALKKVNFDYEL